MAHADGKPSHGTERIGKESSQDARDRERGNAMTWGDAVEWAMAAMPFAGTSAIPVVVSLALNGWDLNRVSWLAWALSAWLLFVSVGGIWGAIADSHRPPREQGRQGQQFM
jgi:hypothetical protein